MENFQPLYHHSNKDYDTAASEAARFARDKIEKMIGEGQSRALSVIEDVQKHVPRDRIVRDEVLTFRYKGGLHVQAKGESEEPVHDHAYRQLLERAGVPNTYANTLIHEGQSWATDLLVHNLNTVYGYSGERHLMRSDNGVLKGFLSDRFRRLDSAPLIESFAQSMQAVGAVPVEGRMTDTRVFIKAMLPVVYEPAKNEIVAFGIQWENSDYGNGAHNLRSFLVRLWCTNFAVAEEGLRQVHVGGKLAEDISFSEETYRLDTETTASAIRDVVKHSLSARNTHLMLNGIKEAHEQRVDPKKAISILKKQLSKGEVEQVIEAFNSPDIENLPPGQTMWRLSNAISWVAGKIENRERAMELEREAGHHVMGLKKVA